MSANEDTPKAPTTGRESNGKFAKGNGGGPGNPHAGQVAKLRAALMARVTVDDIGAAADQLIKLAREGSLSAIKLLFQYTLGKPCSNHEPAELPIPVAPPPAATPDVSPELVREIERALFQPAASDSLLTVTKRDLNGHQGGQKRR